MSQAQGKQESPARVRSAPPPLPSRRVVAASPVKSRPVATPKRASPPPPPLAALRTLRPVTPSMLRPRPMPASACLPPTAAVSSDLVPAAAQVPASSSLLVARPGPATSFVPSRSVSAAGSVAVGRGPLETALASANVAGTRAAAPVDLRSTTASGAGAASRPSTRQVSAPAPVAPSRTRMAKPEGPQLAILPQWEDASAPLRPAPKRRGAAFWFGVGAAGLLTGGLVAAAMGMAPSDYLDLSRLSPARTPVVYTMPVQYIVADPATFAAAAAAADVSVAGQPEAAASSEDVARRSPARARTATKRRARRRRALLSALPPDPRVEAEARKVASASELLARDARATEQGLGATTEQATALPERLTRAQVRDGLQVLRPSLTACAAGAHGTAIADITIGGEGRVSYSLIDGDFAGTDSGSCMARALRGAQFPAFSGPSFKVRYPFAL